MSRVSEVEDGDGGVRAAVTIPSLSDCPLAQVSASESNSGTLVSKTVGRGDTVIETLALESPVADEVDHAMIADDLSTVFTNADETLYQFSRPWGVNCVCEHIEGYDCPVTDVRARDGNLSLTLYAPTIDKFETVIDDLQAHYGDVEVDVKNISEAKIARENAESAPPTSKLGVDEPGPLLTVPNGSMFLIAGAPMSGKFELLLNLLTETADQPLLISTKYPATKLQEPLAARTDGSFGIIDCVGPGPSAGNGTETATIKHVSSPQNLTSIGTGFTELLDQLGDDGGVVGSGIYTLKPLVMHTDLSSVYQFLSVVAGHVRGNDGVGFAVLDTAADEANLQELLPAFDGLIETRRVTDEDARAFRVRGLPSVSGDWAHF